MSGERMLDQAELRVVVPGPRFISARAVVFIVLGVDLLLLLAQVADGGSVRSYAGMALVVTVLVPAIFAIGRVLYGWFTHDLALALDRDRILAPSGWGMKYIEWPEVSAAGFVHSIGPGSTDTWSVDRTLLVFDRAGRLFKLSLPRLKNDEWPALETILQRIADYHAFELVFDTSEAGRSRIKQLKSRS